MMHASSVGRLWAGLAVVALVGCGGSSSKKATFTGETATDWEDLTGTMEMAYGFSEYTPANTASIYMLGSGSISRYDADTATWVTTLAPPTAGFSSYSNAAWVGDKLYQIESGAVYAYSIADDTWTKLLDSGVPETGQSQVAHDDDGNIWTVESASPYRIVKYDPAANAIETFDSGFTGVDEARAAWDSTTKLLFVGRGYDMKEMYAFDPATKTVTQKASAPAKAGGDGTGMGDPFCSDRAGHLYAIADTGCGDSASMFQYDTQTDTWKAIPDVPFKSHGCNGACTVSDDGWLYFTSGEDTSFARLYLYKK